MTRWERLDRLIGHVVLSLALMLLGAALVYAAVPTGSAFPTNLDNFQSVSTMDQWTSTHHNRLLDAINELETRSITGSVQGMCATVNIAAGVRQLVMVPLGFTVAGTEPVFASTIDTTNPARLVADGIQNFGGTTATAWVWNRDTVNTRAGKICIAVVRP